MRAVLILQFLTFVGLCVVVFLLKKALPSYLSEKGKNLATKQDIEEITRKIESVRAEIARGQEIEGTKRRLKYEACLEALSVIDAHFVQLFSEANPTPQPADTVRARECHSKLILSCENVALVEKFGEVFFGPKPGDVQRPPTDLLNEFRNLIRQELGFGSHLNLDRDRAWIARAAGDPKGAKAAKTS